MRRRVVLFLAVSVMVAGCSSSGKPAGSSTSVTSPTSTSTVPPTTTEPPKATGGAPTVRQAAAELVQAWENKDTAAASRIADAMAVMGIFGVPDPSMWVRGCTPDDDPLPEGGCVYRSESGLIQINGERRDQGWVVTSAIYDPLDNGDDTSGDAPDGPPPTTVPPTTASADPTTVN